MQADQLDQQYTSVKTSSKQNQGVFQPSTWFSAVDDHCNPETFSIPESSYQQRESFYKPIDFQRESGAKHRSQSRNNHTPAFPTSNQPFSNKKGLNESNKQSFLCFQKVSENASEVVEYPPSKPQIPQPETFYTHRVLHPEVGTSKQGSNRALKQFTFGDLGVFSETKETAKMNSINNIETSCQKRNLYDQLDDQISNIVGVLTNFNICLKNLVKTKTQDQNLNQQPSSPSSLRLNTTKPDVIKKPKMSLTASSKHEKKSQGNPKTNLTRYQQLLKKSLFQNAKEPSHNDSNIHTELQPTKSITQIKSLLNDLKSNFQVAKPNKMGVSGSHRAPTNESFPLKVQTEASILRNNDLATIGDFGSKNISTSLPQPKNFTNLNTIFEGKRNFGNIKSKVSELLRAKSYSKAVKTFEIEKRSAYVADTPNSRQSFVNPKSLAYLKSRQSHPIEDLLLQKGDIAKQKLLQLREALRPSYHPTLITKKHKSRRSETVSVFDRLYSKTGYLSFNADKSQPRVSAPTNESAKRYNSSSNLTDNVLSDRKRNTASSFFRPTNTSQLYETQQDFQSYYLTKLDDKTKEPNFLIEALSSTGQSRPAESKNKTQKANDRICLGSFLQSRNSRKASRETITPPESLKRKLQDLDRIYHDSKKWLNRKSTKIESMAKQVEDDKLKNCTFHPKIIKKKKAKENVPDEQIDVKLLKDGKVYELVNQSKQEFLKYLTSNNFPGEKSGLKEISNPAQIHNLI